jgi:RNA binding exosome subunit
MTLATSPCTVGLHRLTWRATASAVSNTEAIADALAWLIGDPNDVTLDRSASYHGPQLVLLEASTTKKKNTLHALARLGGTQLRQIIDTLENRLDDDHIVHFRLELNDLIDGHVVLARGSGTGHVKGQAKMEVYPGRPAMEQILETLNEVVTLADRDMNGGEG